MAAVDLKNRTDRLFGRDVDLGLLLQRTGRTGLTAIVGPPQIGKSWVLMELARRLDRETDPRCLVGFTRSPKGANDPLLHVVSDLYQRWLADAGAWDQLEMAWKQQKDGLLPAFARFVGKLSERAGKLVPLVGELGGTAIREALDGLVAASEDLRSGTMVVSRLESMQARELVGSVHKIAGHRIALVMDQWEETRDLDHQRNTFRDFLREPEQWPDCHVVLGAREGGEAAELLRELEREFPGDAQVYVLGEMDLAAETERRRLIAFLHAQPQLRAIENVGDNELLGLIGGYPGVIYRWLADDARETVRTFNGLERLVKERNEFRYSDLEKLLIVLDGDRRKLAVRVALVPLAEDPDAWQVLRSVILAGLDPDTLDDLRLCNILDKESETPRFGHPTRRDAARGFLGRLRRETVRTEMQGLVFALARSVTVVNHSTVAHLGALTGLQDDVRRLNLGSLPLALCNAALSFLGEPLPSPESLIDAAREARRLGEPGLGFVLSVPMLRSCAEAMLNTLVEGRARRDAFLDELRALVRAFPDDAAARRTLSAILYMKLFDINLAQPKSDLNIRDSLLDELRALVSSYPDDSWMRRSLAGVLLNMVHTDVIKDDHGRDVLLAELRALAQTMPDDKLRKTIASLDRIAERLDEL